MKARTMLLFFAVGISAFGCASTQSGKVPPCSGTVITLNQAERASAPSGVKASDTKPTAIGK